jgi:hypothetical protein
VLGLDLVAEHEQATSEMLALLEELQVRPRPPRQDFVADISGNSLRELPPSSPSCRRGGVGASDQELRVRGLRRLEGILPGGPPLDLERLTDAIALLLARGCSNLDQEAFPGVHARAPLVEAPVDLCDEAAVYVRLAELTAEEARPCRSGGGGCR